MTSGIFLPWYKVFRAARLKSRRQKIAVIGKLNDGNLESTTAITMKGNLIFVALTLFTWIATPKILYFNYGVILEGRKTSINFLRKLRLFDCISQDLNKKTSMFFFSLKYMMNKKEQVKV